jgi:hypothetical protein
VQELRNIVGVWVINCSPDGMELWAPTRRAPLVSDYTLRDACSSHVSLPTTSISRESDLAWAYTPWESWKTSLSAGYSGMFSCVIKAWKGPAEEGRLWPIPGGGLNRQLHCMKSQTSTKIHVQEPFKTLQYVVQYNQHRLGPDWHTMSHPNHKHENQKREDLAMAATTAMTTLNW